MEMEAALGVPGWEVHTGLWRLASRSRLHSRFLLCSCYFFILINFLLLLTWEQCRRLVRIIVFGKNSLVMDKLRGLSPGKQPRVILIFHLALEFLSLYSVVQGRPVLYKALSNITAPSVDGSSITSLLPQVLKHQK